MMLVQFAVVVCMTSSVLTTTVQLEIESYGLAYQGQIRTKQSASNGKVLKMADQDAIIYEICIDSFAQFEVKNMIYSSTVGNDIIEIRIDNELVWTTTTTNTGGSNTFNSTGSLGDAVYLSTGRHNLSIEVTSGEGGLYLDYIIVSSPQNASNFGFKCLAEQRQIQIESDSFTGLSETDIKERSYAAEGKSVLLMQGTTVTYDICSLSSFEVSVMDVVYSNDGNSDNVSVSIGDHNMGSFTTIAASNGGHEWNKFKSSGQIGSNITLNAGKHTIEFKVITADEYGVELDYILLNINSSSLIPFEPDCLTQKNIDIEAEDFVTEGGAIKGRLTASKNESVLLKDKESLEKDICLSANANVYFKNVIYSSDGGSDSISLTISSLAVGNFISDAVSNYGNEWGNFKNANITSTIVAQLAKGEHDVSLEVASSDQYGVEIDTVTLTLDFGKYYVTTINCPVLQTLILEAENFTSGNNQGEKFRSKASSEKTIYLKQGDIIRQRVCVTGNVKVELKVIMLSNDGGADDIDILLDSIKIASIQTAAHYQEGHGWNDIQTKTLQGIAFLKSDEYTLEVKATKSDSYGVEIDALQLDTITTDNGSLTIC